MSGNEIAVVVGWLCIGFLFSVWFVNFFLDDYKWADSDKTVGFWTFFFVTLAGPVMMVLMLGFVAISWVTEGGLTNILRRVYGIPKDRW